MFQLLESLYFIDASDISIGTSSNNSIILSLDLDNRSTISSINTIAIYDDIGNNILSSGLPYVLTVTKISQYKYSLNVVFSNPVANVKFGINRKIVLTADNNDTAEIRILVGYSNNYIPSDWQNSTEDLTINNISFKDSLNSVTLSTKLKQLFFNSFNTLNLIKNHIKHYSYKKYIEDILYTSIITQNIPESSDTVITRNSNGDISTIITTFTNGSRYKKVKITYTYASYDIKQLRKRGSTTTILSTYTDNLLNSIKIDSLDSDNNIIYNICQLLINRSISEFSIQDFSDYNSSLPSDEIDLDPDNLLSDYKYIQVAMINGWTMV